MNALLFDEALADALDDGNARRGWFTDIQRERSADPKLEIEADRNAMILDLHRISPVFEELLQPA